MPLNHIRSEKNFKHLIERFWNIKTYWTVSKRDPKLLQKGDSCAIDILMTTTSKEDKIILLVYYGKKTHPHCQTTEHWQFSE